CRRKARFPHARYARVAPFPCPSNDTGVQRRTQRERSDRRIRPTATPCWTAARASMDLALLADAVPDLRDSESRGWLVAGRWVGRAELDTDPARFDPSLAVCGYSSAQVVPVLERVTNDWPCVYLQGRRRWLPGNLNYVFNS